MSRKVKEEKEKKNDEPKSAYEAGLVDLSNFKTYDEKVSTGSLLFDWFLDGGFGVGLYRFGGPPEKGKTAQALTWAAAWLTTVPNSKVVYFDAEARITASKLKASPLVDVPNFESRVILTRCNIYEEIATKLFEMTKENPDKIRYFFVIDSLDMVMSERDFNYAFSEDEKMASVAKLSKRLMRRSGPELRIKGHHLHVLSQLTANIGQTYGPNDKSDFGGHAIKHGTDLWGDIEEIWADDYIWEKPKEKKKADKGKILGHYCKIKFKKTPNEKTGQMIKIPIRHLSSDSPKSGVWRSREIGDLMIMFGMVKASGSWMEISEEMVKEAKKKGIDVQAKIQGSENFYSYLDDNEDVLNVFEGVIRLAIL